MRLGLRLGWVGCLFVCLFFVLNFFASFLGLFLCRDLWDGYFWVDKNKGKILVNLSKGFVRVDYSEGIEKLCMPLFWGDSSKSIQIVNYNSLPPSLYIHVVAEQRCLGLWTNHGVLCTIPILTLRAERLVTLLKGSVIQGSTGHALNHLEAVFFFPFRWVKPAPTPPVNGNQWNNDFLFWKNSTWTKRYKS